MRIFLKDLNHGKEDDNVEKKIDNQAGSPLQPGKINDSIRQSTCDKKCYEETRDKRYHSFYGPRLHTSTGETGVINISAGHSVLR